MYRYIKFFVIVVLFASCEKTIEVDLPEYTPLLVITSNTATDSTIRVKVGKSINILNYNGMQDLNVRNAVVKLYADDKYLETLQYIDTSAFNDGHYFSSLSARPGPLYKITVTAPGFPDAEATSIAPELVNATPVRTGVVRAGEYGFVQSEISIRFKDPATAGDYYYIEIIHPMQIDTTRPDSMFPGYYYGSGCINTSDPSIANLSEFEFEANSCIPTTELYLSDELFNGTEKEFKFFIDSAWVAPYKNKFGKTTYPLMKFHHIPESYFRFLKSNRYASDNYQNPFAEPVNVYTNVKNGYGVFSISNVDAEDIK